MHQTLAHLEFRNLRHQSFAGPIVKALLVAVVFLAATGAPLCSQERMAIHKVPPIYPLVAKQMGITGTVVVTATVDASGKVIKADSTSGNKLLAASAIEAVKQWKFAVGDSTQTFPVAVSFEKF